MAEKKVDLKIKCRRGGSFNGAIEGNAALGGSNKQDSVSFNYNNYIQSSFNLNTIFENLEIIEIQDLSLKIDCSDSLDSKETSIYCQLTVNGSPDYIKMFYIRNNTSIVTQFPQNFLNEDNYKSPTNILITTEFQKNKIYVSGIQLIITYRELETWEIPDENGRIYTKPTTPNIISISGDINESYFENSFKLNIDYVDQCNQIDVRILDSKKAVIYINQYPPCRQIIFNASNIIFTQGETYFVQCSLTNVNGMSEWSTLSNGIIKCNKSYVSITNVYGTNVIEYQSGLYYIDSKASIDGTFNIGLSNITSELYNICEVLIQNNINGIWNDIEDTKTNVSNIGKFTLEIDTDNEIENGGVDTGEYGLIRIKAIFGNKIYYSDPLTLFKCPLSEITPSNITPKIKRIPISNLKINGSFISNKYTLKCRVSCYRQLTDNLEFIYSIMVDNTTKNKFTLDISQFLNTKYSYGDSIILGYSGCNQNGVYSEEVLDVITYQVSEKLDSPILNFKHDYIGGKYNSYNLYYKDKIYLTWEPIVPQLFPGDKITYNIYRNDELIKRTTETTFTDYPNLPNVVYCVSVTNGYDEFKSIPKLKNKITESDRPQFKQYQSISFRPVSTLFTKENISLTSQSTLPPKVIITFPPATSVTTPQEELIYILHCGYYNEGGPQTYISCCELNNVVYDPIRQMNDAIIDFSDWGLPSGNIVMCLTCVDKYGLESAKRTPFEN